jgi:ankyrin repeat protein
MFSITRPRKTILSALILIAAVPLLIGGHITFAAPKPKPANQKTASKAALTKALFNAIDNNDLHAVQNLLARGADVNARFDPFGSGTQQTPLMAALYTSMVHRKVSLPIIEFLVNKKADVNAKDAAGTSICIYAVDSDSIEALKFLIEHGADVNARGQAGTTPLMEAAQAGNTAMVALLIQKGAKLDAKSDEGETALTQAASFNKINTAKVLLVAGANANITVDGGYTPLSTAIVSSMGTHKTDFITLLLDYGAKPDPDAMGLAAGFGEREVVELLLARGAGKGISNESLIGALLHLLINGNMMNVKMGLYGYAATLSDKEKMDALSKAENDDVAIAKDLLALNPNFSQYPNNRILTFAAADGIAPIVRMLLNKGAPVNGSNTPKTNGTNRAPASEDDFISRLAAEIVPNDMTPLMAAAEKGHSDVCQMLLDAGADPNLKDAIGQTALMHVAQSGRNKIAHDLPRLRENVLHRADDSAEKPTSRDVKPAEAAAMQKRADEGDIAIIKTLLAKKANLEARDNKGQTALMIAAANSSTAVVQTLITAGADVNARDASGQNALMKVVQNGRISRAPELFSFELQNAVQGIEHGIKIGSELYNTPEAKAIAAKTKAAAAKQKAEVINAAIAQDVAVIKVLLAEGIDPNAKDKKGQTALQMAQKMHHAAIVSLLKQTKIK